MSDRKQPPAIDAMTVEPHSGSSYPEGFRETTEARVKRRLGDALGLTGFGINLVTMAPGCWSAQRHWHSLEDEFVYVLSGRLTLVTESGEQELGPGMIAGFPAGVADGHCLINKSDQPATYLEVGDRIEADAVAYPDIDLAIPAGGGFTNKAGEPY